MLWPVTVAHKMDHDSVFYNMTPRDILAAQFEIVVTLEGVTEETGNTIQVMPCTKGRGKLFKFSNIKTSWRVVFCTQIRRGR